MNAEQHKTLQKLRYLLRKSGCFAFEKGGNFYLYRQGEAGDRNTLVLKHADIDTFYTKARKAAGV